MKTFMIFQRILMDGKISFPWMEASVRRANESYSNFTNEIVTEMKS